MKWFRQSPWPGVTVVLLGIVLAETHRACDSRKMAQEDQDMLVRRMDLRFDWLKTADLVKSIWMENASQKLGVQPPMRMPTEWPQDGPVCRPLEPSGLYASEPLPTEVP